MSASHSPPNPGTPKKGSSTPNPSLLRRTGGPLLLSGLAIGIAYSLYATRAPKVPGTPTINPLRTTGVKNIENAYANGGATATHTPAYGGTKQGTGGSREQNATMREDAATGKQLPKNFQTEGVGDDQRHNPEDPNALKGLWNDMKHGSDKTK